MQTESELEKVSFDYKDSSDINWIACPSKDRVLVRDLMDWILQQGDCTLLLNSDIELTADARMLGHQDLLERVGDSLLYLVRLNHPPDRSSFIPDVWGLDGFLFRPTKNPFVNTEFCIGQPWWDYVLPSVLMDEKVKLYSTTKPIALHETHPFGWSDQNWCRYGRMFMELKGRRNFPEKWLHNQALAVRRDIRENTIFL